jgi:predicted CoA-binding protein
MTIRHSPERDASPPPPSGQRRAEPGQEPVRLRHDASPPHTPVPPGRHPASALTPMLEARSIALVGASPRPGTFGQRMVEEVARSPSRPEVHLVNPRYAEIGGQRCVPSLDDLPGAVDLVLLAVPDAALEQQLALAARRGDRSAVIFGNAHQDPAGTRGHGREPGVPRRTARHRAMDVPKGRL